MNSSNVQEVIHGQSERFVDELEKYESDFENAVSSFMTSNNKNCLLIETKDSKVGVIRIMHLLKQLKEGQVNEKSLGRYLGAENQTFLNWKQLLDVSGAAKKLPTFTNLLVCMFPDRESTKIENTEEEIFSKISDRLNKAVLKKIIFVTSNKGYLDKYLKKVDVKAFLKIDEFENKVTSVIGDGKTALIDKASSGDVIGVEELLKNGVEVNGTSGEDQLTALYVAAEKGHTNVVLTLLRNGADLLPNKLGDTPLYTAAEKGHTDVVSVLLENGANVNHISSFKRTVLHYAARNGNNDVVKTLLEHEAHVDAQDEVGRTPLHVAVENGKIEVVNTLLNCGADVNAKDMDEWTPLMWAAYTNRVEIVKVLAEKGANVHEKDKKGKTALDLCLQRGFVNMVTLLKTI